MVEIIPAILAVTPEDFKSMTWKVEPYTQRVHIDIADGIFVPNKTVSGYEELKSFESAVKLDIHLMVVKPQDQIKEWLYSNADRFIIHAESEDPGTVLKIIRDNGRKAGLAVNPDTGPEKIEPFFKNIDFVQFMTVHPGFQGSPFVKDVVDKIASFHAKYPDILIMCDGGVTPETAPHLVKAGVSSLVSGSYILKSDDVAKAILDLKV